jgi:hypothetical protein
MVKVNSDTQMGKYILETSKMVKDTAKDKSFKQM